MSLELSVNGILNSHVTLYDKFQIEKCKFDSLLVWGCVQKTACLVDENSSLTRVGVTQTPKDLSTNGRLDLRQS